MTDPTQNATDGAATMSGKTSGFRTLVGYHTVAWARDYGEIELQLAARHGNSIGITHGGVYMTIMDAAMGHAATWCAVPGNVRICVTVSLSTNFIQPAKGKVIRAIGRLHGIHNRIGTVMADVLDEDGTLLASGQGSFRYSPGSETYDGVPKALARRR
jgi:uncharacterized protein (TIGR00369 family)